MNWLAHLLLSDDRIDHRLGNLLADPLKGRSWEGASPALREGMETHRRIDAFTDASPIVARSKARLGAEGRLRGVVVDIVYDHLLAANWTHYCDAPLDDFIARFHREARRAVDGYPAAAKAFVHRLIEHEILESYATFEGVETALIRLERRCSPRLFAREPARSYLPALRRALPQLQNDFDVFFPELIAHVGPAFAPAPADRASIRR